MTQQEVNRLIDKYMALRRGDGCKEAGSSAPLYRLECGSGGSLSDIVVHAGEIQCFNSSTGDYSSNSATAHSNGET